MIDSDSNNDIPQEGGYDHIQTRIASMRKIFMLALIHSAVSSGLLGADAADFGIPVNLTPSSLDLAIEASSYDELPTVGAPNILEAVQTRGTSFASGLPAEPDFTPEPVAWNQSRPDRRFYISGMLGPSFANLSARSIDTSDDLFAAGGSIGMSFERARGRLRIETEAVGRDTYFGEVAGPQGRLAFSNWSVTENIWRDFMLTDRLGIYGGGGLGAGGYRYAVGNIQTGARLYGEPGTALAWQVGGGLTFEITDRLTFDVGYRYFHIDTINARNSSGAFVTPTDFSASELMFSLRFFEPFRAWVR